jgi:RNA polymerase sigma-70 factor (ECF subfamily)
MTTQEDRVLEDRALVAAVAAQQQDALERLYDRYQAMVYHLALKVLNRRESAEEVVYEVFWQVWREAGRYDARRGSVGAWLATLARSRAIDAFRAGRGERPGEEDVTAHAIAADPKEGPEETVELGQRASLVRAALDSLPPDQRTALELAFFRGLSHSEIAEHLAEPLGTVKTRIRSAMLRLHDRLRPLLGTGA